MENQRNVCELTRNFARKDAEKDPKAVEKLIKSSASGAHELRFFANINTRAPSYSRVRCHITRNIVTVCKFARATDSKLKFRAPVNRKTIAIEIMRLIC